jgi:hypothetical protein
MESSILMRAHPSGGHNAFLRFGKSNKAFDKPALAFEGGKGVEEMDGVYYIQLPFQFLQTRSLRF